jgi:drug/metabolite transporter (DMT)-like permease
MQPHQKESMSWTSRIAQPGVLAALGSACLFGAGTPVAKILLGGMSPWLLAGLLYLGSGIGLATYRLFVGAPTVRLARHEALWFGAAICFGGIIGPILLLLGLSNMPASGASLLLNAEGVFTALLAWFTFKENFDRRIAIGMLSILVGAAVLSWDSNATLGSLWPSLSVLGACLAWGIDNNLTRKVSLVDAAWLACVKGLVAGAVNLSLAFLLGAIIPSLSVVLSAMIVGFLAYGVSLTLFVLGLRHLGTARAAAYFSVAPFVGTAIALILGEPISMQLLVAALFMAFGIWLHLTEQHAHSHEHLPMEHDHEHRHDDGHHTHGHDHPFEESVKHSHLHQHSSISHTHAHFPDAHHRHQH